jgi:catechol 2,3-dioxygenase-like lactoylglutathione lyase family enzyme
VKRCHHALPPAFELSRAPAGLTIAAMNRSLHSLITAPAALAAGLITFLAPNSLRAGDNSAEFTKGVIDIGIVVKDPTRTAEFLTNAIGFTEVKGFAVTSELGKRIGLIDGFATDVRVFTLVDTNLSTRIKVLSFPKAEAKTPDQKFIHSQVGMRYLTLYVQDMNRALERLKAAKVKPIGETPLDLGGGTYITVVRDPDGNFVELIGPMKP